MAPPLPESDQAMPPIAVEVPSLTWHAPWVRSLQGMARVRSGRLPPGPWSLAGGGAEAPRSRAGPEDDFCEAVRNDLRVPLTVEGHPRTLSGPSPDPGLTTALHLRVRQLDLSGLGLSVRELDRTGAVMPVTCDAVRPRVTRGCSCDLWLIAPCHEPSQL